MVCLGRVGRGAGTYSAGGKKRERDGKLVVAGTCWDGVLLNGCAARYLANGSIDLSVNGTGYVVGLMGAMAAYGDAVALEGNQIVIAGRCGNSLCVVRLNPDGSPDLTVHGTGKVVTTPDCPFGLSAPAKMECALDGTGGDGGGAGGADGRRTRHGARGLLGGGEGCARAR